MPYISKISALTTTSKSLSVRKFNRKNFSKLNNDTQLTSEQITTCNRLNNNLQEIQNALFLNITNKKIHKAA